MNRRAPFAPLCIALAGIAVPAAAGNWTGKETPKDGVVHVTNPGAPSDGKSTVTLQELWRAGGDDEEVIFGVVNDVAVDTQGNLYALDTQLSQVSVFDPDGNLLRTIGREGEGPGEFRRASQLFVTPDNKIAVAQMMPGKLVLLTPDGKPGGDFPMPAAPDGGTQMIWDAGAAGRSVVIGGGTFAQKDNKMTRTTALQLYGMDGTSRGTLVERTSTDDIANMKFDEKSARRPVWTASADGKIYLNDNFDVYEIKYYGTDGKLARVATRDYQHRARSKAEMEEDRPRIMMRRGGGGGRRFDAEPSPTDPDVIQMFARDDGTLWVLSSRGRDCPKGTIGRFDVFDANGHFVREVTVQGEGNAKADGVTIAGDRLILLKGLRSAQRAMMAAMSDDSAAEEEEEGEPMAIVSYRLDPQPTAKR
ncbi:MAG TPA: 6-bladed beta-propeller [Candidatus Krumholzibacteria bacterium]|nr:6-bladed beta-propeller [Candidatus Krumholzibacteria bacterium]